MYVFYYLRHKSKLNSIIDDKHVKDYNRPISTLNRVRKKRRDTNEQYSIFFQQAHKDKLKVIELSM